MFDLEMRLNRTIFKTVLRYIFLDVYRFLASTELNGTLWETFCGPIQNEKRSQLRKDSFVQDPRWPREPNMTSLFILTMLDTHLLYWIEVGPNPFVPLG